MILSVVTRERLHLVLSSYIEVISDVILCGWLGLKHQLTKVYWSTWIFYNCSTNHKDILHSCNCHRLSWSVVIKCVHPNKTKALSVKRKTCHALWSNKTGFWKNHPRFESNEKVKSTLLWLLVHFFSGTAGGIMYNGITLNFDLNLCNWSSRAE